MPTVWTERTATAGAFTEGNAENDGSSDYFIDVLFEGTGLFGLVAASYVERTAAAAAGTERVAASASWTERTV